MTDATPAPATPAATAAPATPDAALYPAGATPTTEVSPQAAPADTPPAEPGTEVTPEVTPPSPPAFDASALKLPDGFTVDESMMAKFGEALVNPALSPNERGQQLLDLYHELSSTAAQSAQADWDNTQTAWRAEVEKDPAIGGTKLESTIASVAKLMDQFGSDDLRSAMDLTGAGNNPAVIRFLAKVSSALSEGRPVTPSGPPSRRQTPAERLYGASPN